MFGDCAFANFVSFAGEIYTPFTYKMKKWNKIGKNTISKHFWKC
jgi:hypothetical protein